jgi:ADP-ribose pyrophosphatase YjhB (NUDIX family)
MFEARSIRHCKRCGAATTYRVPADDNRERAVCGACALVHYENPLNVVGTLPVWGDRVLLCRRAIEPRYGLWTLPAGFMELGETTEQGALRETDEEAGARVRLLGLFSVLNVLRVGQVHLFYRAELLDTDFAPGSESLEVALFREPEIPWEELAFRTVRDTLRSYFADRARGSFGLHCGDID